MIFALFALVLALFQAPTLVAAIEIGPEGDWCETINSADAGDEVVLGPGNYAGPCTLTRSGAPGAPLVIRARDLPDAPTIVYDGRQNNVFNVRASHVVIRGLRFGPTKADVDAVRIYSGSHITVEDCRFRDLGGIAVVASHASVAHVVVRRNEILESRATAMYFGCHDGLSCVASDFVLERNYIRGVDAPEGEIGYGIQIKLNSTAVIRDNVIVNTKGPGIMVYGATIPSVASQVERNFVMGSRTSSGIVVGGGPVLVRNNIVTTNADAGIGLEDYHRRGLLRGIVLVHNTVYGNAQGGILVPPAGPLDVVIANNAVQPRAGTLAFPAQRPGVLSVGNVDCTAPRCFVDPDLQDFSPLGIQSGSPVAEPWIPASDYFGRRRGVPPAVGAIEAPGSPIRLGVKRTSQ